MITDRRGSREDGLGGRYRPGLLPGVSIPAIACCAMAGAACDVGGGEVLLSEPRGDHKGADAGMQQSHHDGVAQQQTPVDL